jgi:hypothetical protein
VVLRNGQRVRLVQIEREVGREGVVDDGVDDHGFGFDEPAASSRLLCLVRPKGRFPGPSFAEVSDPRHSAGDERRLSQPQPWSFCRSGPAIGMEGVREDSPSIRWRSCPVLAAPDRTRLGLFRQAEREGGGRRRLLARLHLRWPLQPLVTSPTCSRLSHQALAHKSVDLLAEEVALLACHARKRVLSPPRPIGHVWVYSGRITEMLRERLDRNSEPLTQRRRARAGPSCSRGAPLPRAGNPGSQRRTHQAVTVSTSGQGA